VTIHGLAVITASDPGLEICTSGAVVSRTNTVNVALVELPERSAALQVTVVEPRANTLPDCGRHATDTVPSTVSSAVGDVHVAAAPFGPVASRGMFAGTLLITGSVVSATLTVNVSLLLLPDESVAVQETTVDPSGNVAPDTGAQTTCGKESMLSVADAA